VSKRLRTLAAIFTRGRGRVWTSCRAKRLKYSVNEGGVRYGAILAALALKRRCNAVALVQKGAGNPFAALRGLKSFNGWAIRPLYNKRAGSIDLSLK
jgi:hypothetical protein